MSHSKGRALVTRLLTENAGWKLSALLISAGLWYAYVGETELAASVPVAVQFQNVPSDLEVTPETLDRVFLRLRGPATRLNIGNLTQVTVRLDLADIHKAGERTFSLGPGNLRLPPGVHVGQVVPSQIRLTFQKRVTRDIPIEVRYSGPPPSGYRVANEQVSPSKVRVIGPESNVEDLASAQTDAIDLSSAVGNPEFRVPVYLPDAQVRLDGPATLVSVRVSLKKIPE